MAKRRGWNDLSDDYRARLSRSGITRSAYERGASLSGARGHGATPEHPIAPGTPVAPRYKRWFNERYNSPIKMLATTGEVWLVSVPKAQRSLIAAHWNAIRSYLFAIPMRHAMFWRGDTRTVLDWFAGKTVSGSEIHADTSLGPSRKWEFMTDLVDIADWTYEDEVSFDDVYKAVA